MNAIIGALRVTLGLDSAAFDKGIRDTSAKLGQIGDKFKRIGAGMTAGVTAPLGAIGAMTIQTAGNFEASMNRVQAATSATGDEFTAMRDLAIELGSQTSFSAAQSADAMEMLAKNGLSASQIMDGAVSASMKLAAASGSELSAAADVATDVMMSFGKQAKDLEGVVDGVTGVLLESKFGFDDYRLAIGQAGGVAGNLGVEFDDFNAVIAATSSSFASGSDAGTSFKNFLTRLVPASDAAAATMERLGLSFFEADGSMKSMSAIAGELQSKMSSLSEEELNTAMKDIFGVDAMRTAIGLMKQGTDGIDQFRSRIAEGSAEEQAAARLKGFRGEMEKLNGAIESLQIAIADSGLLATVTGIVTSLAGWAEKLGELNPEILKWGTIIGGLVAVLGPAAIAVGVLVTAIAAVSAPVLAFAAGMAAGTAAVVAFWPEIVKMKDAIVNFMSGDVLAKIADIGKQIVNGIVSGIKSAPGAVKDALLGVIGDAWQGAKDFLGIRSPSRLFAEMGGYAIEGLGQGMESMSGHVEGIADRIASTVANAFQGLIDGSKTVKDVISDLLGQLSQMLIHEGFRALTQGIFGGGMGGGGFFGGLIGGIGKLFGFANGGQFQVGGAGGIDSQLVAFKASPNETVTVTKPGQEMSRGLHVRVSASDLFHVMVQEEADGRVQAAAPRIVGSAVARSRRMVVPEVGRYQRDVAGGDYRG